MKKILVALLLVALLFLVSCSFISSQLVELIKDAENISTESQEDLEEETNFENEKEEEKEADLEDEKDVEEKPIDEAEDKEEAIDSPMEITFKRLHIAVAGAELSKSWDDLPIVRVYYDITNISDNDIIDSFYAWDTDRVAYQNDEEIIISIASVDNVEEYENYSRRIYPGVTNRAAEHYILVDEENDVKIILSGKSDEDILEIILDLDNLPEVKPAPEIAPVPKPDSIANDEGYAGLEVDIESDILGQYELKLVKHDFIENKGDKYIRLYFYFSVLGGIEEDDTTSPFMVTRYYLYQDGIQIGSTMGSGDSTFYFDKLPEYEAYTEDIGLGESVEYAVVFKLRSDSDVIVKASSYFSDPIDGDPFIGDIFPVE